MSTSLGTSQVDESLRLAAQVGAEGLEVCVQTDKQVHELARKGYPAKLADMASQAGLAIPSICLSLLCRSTSLIGTAEQMESGKKKVVTALNAAAEAGVRVVLVPFFGHNAIELEDELRRAAEALLDLAEPAEQAGVTIGVESTLNFDQQDYLLNQLGHTEAVRMYVDTANTMARKLDFATGIRQLGAAGIAQVHFKDVRLAEGRPPDYDVPLGSGDVDFQAALRAMRAIGYDGWVVLETPPGHDPAASAKANLAFARAQLAAAV